MVPSEIGIPVLLFGALFMYAGVVFIPSLYEKWKKSHRRH